MGKNKKFGKKRARQARQMKRQKNLSSYKRLENAREITDLTRHFCQMDITPLPGTLAARLEEESNKTNPRKGTKTLPQPPKIPDQILEMMKTMNI